MECFACRNETFELRQVSWPINVGGHVVAHDIERSVCTACGRWTIDAVTLQRFELLTVQQVLLNHPFTPAIGKDARKTLGLNRATLGERLGVTEQKVVAWENDETAPPWFQLALGGLVIAELLASPRPLELVYHAQLDREGARWLVEFPDCPGCQTFGESKEEALAAGKEALEGWLESHVGLNRRPPMPAATEGEPIVIEGKLAAEIVELWWPKRG